MQPRMVPFENLPPEIQAKLGAVAPRRPLWAPLLDAGVVDGNEVLSEWHRWVRLAEKIRRPPVDIWRTALHEAAHATVAFCEGRRIRSVWVDPARWPEPGLFEAVPVGGLLNPERIARITCAGPAAEAVFGFAVGDYRPAHGEEYLRAAVILYKTGRAIDATSLRWMQDDALRAVRARRRTIEHLAKALARLGCIRGGVAESIIGLSLGPRGWWSARRNRALWPNPETGR